MDLYGWLIGSWALDVTRFLPDGSTRKRPGEWHFGWVLEGRAIQDVWVVPPRGAQRSGDAAANINVYGTTLRVYDPQNRCLADPMDRPRDADLPHHGRPQAGQRHRAARKEPGRQPDPLELLRDRAERFRWRGEVSVDSGATWRLDVDFIARRI